MRSKHFAGILLAGAIGIAAIGGVSAYLTDSETVSNTFTVGKVDIDIDEPNWDPEDNKKIEPGKVISKDPQIKNTGNNDAYVFMKVSIPKAEIESVSGEGAKQEKTMQELFSFTASDSWTLLESKADDGKQSYVYAYNQILKPEETTAALFDKLVFVNAVEGQLEGQTLEVPVYAYAIQTTDTGADSENVVENAKAAYQKYVDQNK